MPSHGRVARRFRRRHVLTGPEADRVRDHVAQCPHCRETVEALRQSLEIAQTIWQDNAQDVGRARARRSHKWRHIAAAAGILLAIGILAQRTPPNQSPPAAPTMDEIERRIAEAGHAASLLAAVDGLETLPALREVAERQYKYIVDNYPDTPVAEPARLKLQALE